MFKPQRLIYREATSVTGATDSRWEKALTEKLPDALAVVAEHPVEIVEVAGEATKDVIMATRQALKGTLKATWEIGKTFKNTASDALAAPAMGVIEGAKSIKAMTWDTPGHVFKGEGKKAAASFFKYGLWGAIKTPFKAVWNGLKGIANMPLDLFRGGAKTIGHVAGLKMNKERDLEPGEHGLIPAFGWMLKGVGKTFRAPLGKRFRNKILDNPDFRFDTSVKWGGGSSSPKEKDHGKSESWWKDDTAHGGHEDAHGEHTAAGQRTSAFGKAKDGTHASAESGQRQPAHSASQVTAALAAAQQEAQTATAQPAPARAHGAGGHHGQQTPHAANAHAAPAGNAPVAPATPHAHAKPRTHEAPPAAAPATTTPAAATNTTPTPDNLTAA